MPVSLGIAEWTLVVCVQALLLVVAGLYVAALATRLRSTQDRSSDDSQTMDREIRRNTGSAGIEHVGTTGEHTEAEMEYV